MEGIDPNLAPIINAVKDKLGNLIQRPKLTEKLLSKPPFRFLHDVISAVTQTTGFAEGLFSGAELDAAGITDKQAKLNYLDKIFAFVGICKGRALEVKSIKVVTGQEPEHTNAFLLDLATFASDSGIDNNEAVRRCLNGELPGDKPPPYRRAEAKSDSAANYSSSAKQSAEIESKDSGAKADSKMADIDPAPAPERGKSRSGTRGGKPTQATTDTGLSGFSGSAAPKLDAEIESCDGSEARTQQLLGELITRPKLTEKLLGKPPFRFLHDIVTEVIRSTNFANGLYSAEEMDSANCQEKNQKILFLEKIIKVVGVQLNTLVEAKPMKIVSGLDPQITNNFLQLLAVAAKHMPDSRMAVSTVLDQLNSDQPSAAAGTKDDAPAAKPPSLSAPAPVPVQPSEVDMPRGREEKREERQKPQPLRQSQALPVSEPKSEPKESRLEEREEKMMGGGGSMEEGVEDDGEAKRSGRPTTARRRPPKVKDGVKEMQANAAPASKKTEGIIMDGAVDEDEDIPIADDTRLLDDLKPDAKGVSSGPVESDSKIVKDILARQKEQEAASRQAKPEEKEEKSPISEQGGSGGIRINRLKTKDKKGGPSMPAGGLGETELEKLRGSIQVLVQHTGPLGSCMDFIQEDITLMTAELHRWEEECRRYEAEYEEAKKKTKEVLHPLKIEFAELEDQILEMTAKISSAKASTARNDEKMQQILKIIATA